MQKCGLGEGTHYHGCECWEKKRDAEIQDLKAALIVEQGAHKYTLKGFNALKEELEKRKGCDHLDSRYRELLKTLDRHREAAMGLFEVLEAMVEAVKKEPAMNSRKYDDLGCRVRKAVSTYSRSVEEKEGVEPRPAMYPVPRNPKHEESK